MKQNAFRHEVLFYGDPDEFLAGTAPFLRDALEAGESAFVAIRRTRIEALQDELGADAALVRFADMEELGRNPARIIPFWREFVEQHDGAVRGIGEPIWPDRSSAELDECRRHEQLLNVAFDGQPSWSLLCPYDSSGLADDILEAAALSHPFLAREGAAKPNPDCADGDPAAGVFAGHLAAPVTVSVALKFGRDGLHRVRALVAAEAERVGLLAERASDLVTAASELAANSVAHGGGWGMVSIWQEDGELGVDVEDAGVIDEPLVGRLRPLPTQEGGRGLWIANLLCDLVQVRSDDAGTTIRLRMSLE